MVLLLVAACSRCAGDAPDASTPAAATDIRTALFTIFPEFRYARVTHGLAQIRREVSCDCDLAAEEAQALAAQGFDDAGRRDRFIATVEGNALVLTLPIENDDIARLLQSPAPLTTEQLAYYLPMPKKARLLREEFIVDLEYIVARPEHATMLVSQLHRLLVGGEWTGGPPPPADGGEFTSRYERARTGSVITVDEHAGRVHLRFIQPTR